MTPEQAWQILVQLVNQTRALPQEVDAMRQALQILRPKPTKKDEEPKDDTRGSKSL